MTWQGVFPGVVLGLIHWSLWFRSLKLLTAREQTRLLPRLAASLLFLRALMTLTLATLLVRKGLSTPVEIVTGLLIGSVGVRALLHYRLRA